MPATGDDGEGGGITLAGAAGGAIAGDGGDANIVGGAGGGSGTGGDVNLTPGAGGASGVAGQVKVNGNANLIYATYMFSSTPAADDQAFFLATRALKIVSISAVHGVAAGGTSTLDVTKDTGTTAPGAGTVLTTGAFNLNATANTVQDGTLAAAATITLAAGNRLSVKYNHTIQSSAGVVVSVGMVPI
jgi:hypothetical protein